MTELRPIQPARPRGLRFLPGFLFDTAQPEVAYVLKAWLLTLLPSMAIAALVATAFEGAPAPDFGGTGPVVFAMLVLFAPVVETFLMVPPILILNRFFGRAPAVIGSAVLWGILHSLAVPTWGLVIWWPFLIFSAIIVAWRERDLAKAMVLVIAVHAMQNAVGGLGLLLA